MRTKFTSLADWTNTALLGTRELFLIDPGGDDPEVLLREIRKRTEQGAKLRGVIFSHHHRDHIDGYHRLGLSHLPLYCHPLTAELLDGSYPKTSPLEDQQVLEIESGLSLISHFTPGHAPGHLAFEIPQCKVLLASDMVSSLSSIVIPSDNGSLTDYLDSLQKLRQRQCNLVIPSHGPPFGSGSDPFGQAIQHRSMREEQVLRLVKMAPQSVEDIALKLYPGLDSRLVPAARCNITHHLTKLLIEGQLFEEQGIWHSSSPPS